MSAPTTIETRRCDGCAHGDSKSPFRGVWCRRTGRAEASDFYCAAWEARPCSTCGDMGLVYERRGDDSWDASDCPTCFPCSWRVLNPRPTDYESAALTAELQEPKEANP